MTRLDKWDIEYIQRDLLKRGLVYDALTDELTDHICFEVEQLLSQGWEFKKAYEKVLSDVSDEDLLKLQDSTYRAGHNNTIMIIRNNLKIMVRNLAKNKTYALLTIGGLALGLSCLILISLFIKHELSFDQSLENSESLYRITMSSEVGGKTNHIPTSFPTLGPLLKENFDELRNFTRIINYKYSRQRPTFRYGESTFYEDKVIFVDSSFFHLFSFPFIEGVPSKALANPQSVVITEQMALKYFGQNNAVGKILNFNGKVDLEVAGVIKNLPSNIHLQFDFVVPISNLTHSGIFFGAKALESWQMDWFWTYLAIPDKSAVSRIAVGLNQLTKEKTKDFNKAKFYLQPVNDVHLHSRFDYGTDISQNGDMSTVYIFVSIGVLIFLISSINFINLTIAFSTRRCKEIGISKALGVLKSQLRLQFVMESVFMSLAAFLIAILMLQVMIPPFESLLKISLGYDWLSNPQEISIAFTFAIMVGIVSGLYPAFFVSSFEPLRILKGVWRPDKGGVRFRQALVGLQITISLFLVIGTIVVLQQTSFIRHKDLGYAKEHVVMLGVRGTDIPKSYYAFKDRLESHTSITSVSSVSEPIGREVQFMAFKVEGQSENQLVKILNVGSDFTKTMGLLLKEGRDFSPEVLSDSTSGFLINESAAKLYGWQEPLGKGIQHAYWDNAPEGKVIGVVKDFNFEPLRAKIDPLIIFKGVPAWFIAVRIEPNQLHESLSVLRSAWLEFEPNKPFNFQFLDQSIQQVYDSEERLSQLLIAFSVLSMITVILGLYGLISFTSEQRLPEIGVRKVLGASVGNVLILFAKDYFKILITSFLLAAPITYLIMTNWLQNFAFHIDISPMSFLIGWGIVIFIVNVTVITRAWPAARTNPVDVLRSE